MLLEGGKCTGGVGARHPPASSEAGMGPWEWEVVLITWNSGSGHLAMGVPVSSPSWRGKEFSPQPPPQVLPPPALCKHLPVREADHLPGSTPAHHVWKLSHLSPYSFHPTPSSSPERPSSERPTECPSRREFCSGLRSGTLLLFHRTLLTLAFFLPARRAPTLVIFFMSKGTGVLKT